MIITFIRSLILYILVIFSVRLMGKRQIGELQPTELVITILISNIATLPMEDLDTPLVIGAVPILSLVCFDVLFSWATLKSKRLRKAMSGSPKIIIKDGKIDQQVMKDLRFSIDDLMTALRINDIFDASEVQFAIVETTGDISIYERFESQNVTNGDMGIKGESKNPPDIIISDGVLIQSGLDSSGMNRKWLDKILSKKKIEIGDVFLLTSDDKGNYNLVERAKSIGKN
ncbi:MAG: DUF421 domain-containing protein [Clostridiales bacterium]|nr:DUF421 domain-containing protein [Clostridiales bacterium]